MQAEARRRLGTSRIIALHEDDGDFERISGPKASPQAQMEGLWDLTLEYLAWTRPDDREPRLQRSVCRIERRQG